MGSIVSLRFDHVELMGGLEWFAHLLALLLAEMLPQVPLF